MSLTLTLALPLALAPIQAILLPKVPRVDEASEASPGPEPRPASEQVLQVDEASKAWRASKGIECSKEECYPEALRPVLEQKNNFKQ